MLLRHNNESMDALKYQLRSIEKIPVRIWENSKEASKHVARSIALAVRQKQQEGENIVLGLATGSTPITLYKELVRIHQEEELSFANVITFNLDEYYGVPSTHPASFRQFMQSHLFDHVDIISANTYLPESNGINPRSVGPRYEAQIKASGGIDLQILGIGRNGHIGFN